MGMGLMKRRVLDFCLYGSLSLLAACGQARENLTHQGTYQIPHPDDWKAGHVAHLVSADDLKAAQTPCLTCHAGNPKALVLGSSISCGASCHSSLNKVTTKKLSKVSDVTLLKNSCSSCHNQQSENRTHYPVAANLCSTCHVTASTHEQEKTKATAQVRSVQDSCFRCHTSFDEVKYPHAALQGANACSTCHDAHGSNYPSILLKPIKEVCSDCHDDVIPQGVKSVHAALNAADSCASCHNPHGSDYPKLLKANALDTCSQCHSNISAANTSIHAPLTDSKSCFNCHVAHASNQLHLLKAAPQSLCLACHNREYISNDPSKENIPNIAAKMANEDLVHPALLMEDCTTTCHSPHSSGFENLLKFAYPSDLYNLYQANPNTYALCFKCHETMLLKENITASDTKFRNDVLVNGAVQRLNLHWYHVVKGAESGPERGRSCNICHDPHGSTQPHSIATSWHTGLRDLPIEYSATPNGGTCTKSCHSSKSYQRLP